MKKQKGIQDQRHSAPGSERSHHGRIFSAPDQTQCLDPVQLHQLERSFRDWTEAASRSNVRPARRRILLIFLLIRYTGAKLSEVLDLNPFEDIDFDHRCVRFGGMQETSDRPPRTVQISENLCQEIRAILSDASFKKGLQNLLKADPGFVRRKFYERAEACGFSKELGAPENLRKSRAVELMQNNLPLPAVQMLLGHSTPNLTSSYVSFSADDIQHVTRLVLDKESARKTSARNTFYGKVQTIQKGDIQTRIELATLSGNRISTVITNDSLQRLGLKVGKLITAEVKAPWVMLHKSAEEPICSADNRLNGTVETVVQGEISSEYIVRIPDGTQVCALVTRESVQRLPLMEGDSVWAVFSSYAVVLMAE